MIEKYPYDIAYKRHFLHKNVKYEVHL